ncbi:hypothetical protein N7474_007794 [Penicillium riverlandense]|uniref:uncharacterized protein n=1 Tax=Penicillium riverlandense TaxID=1903569 RepID=UPI00254945EF|nr:uncharacterized protein N7474_007794 [Penicillium riverlandense]KAJ5811493.1 hypothetical protein N7474_007794 [Penicillium riverlandense]
MAPQLNYVFTMRAYLSRENSFTIPKIKDGPSRVILPITHGFIEGSGIKATIIPGGGDWILMDPSTNVCHLNVRTQARTSDGKHNIYVHYPGVLRVDEAGGKVMGWASDAKSTQYGDHDWFASPVIETDDPACKWVETSLFVGQGRYVIDDDGSAVEYQIFKVGN